MGEETQSTTGLKAKLARPLDFLVIADHSDGLAALKQIHDAPGFLLTDPTLRRWHDEFWGGFLRGNQGGKKEKGQQSEQSHGFNVSFM
jgi:hypothetical protein